jgi:hypothetical protein
LLSTVEVFNRLDGEQGRLDGNGTVPYTLTIYNGVPGPSTVTFTENLLFTPAASLTGPKELGQIITLPTAGVLGDVVRITQNNNDYMNLAELKAFTPEPSSFVLGGLAAVGMLLAARRRRLQTFLACCLAMVAFTTSANAAAITWTDGSFKTDAILPTQQVVYAVGFGNSSAVTTANGVTFGADNQTNVTFSTASNYNAYLSGGGTTGDASFNTVLNDGDYGINGNLTLNNLHIGTLYRVMLLVDDTRSCCADRTGSVADGPLDGSHSSSTIQFAFNAGTPAIGAYYTGTFTANATTQLIVVNNQGGNQIDGLVLSTPEPSSFVLGGLGAIGLFVAARRRRKA